MTLRRRRLVRVPGSSANLGPGFDVLASTEGVFCEPASAASIAGLLTHGVHGARRVVCVLTGHGLKDPQVALEHVGAVVSCEPHLSALEEAVLG